MNKKLLLFATTVLICTTIQGQIITPSHEKKAKELTDQMTIEEKLDYIGGYNAFYIRAIPRLGIPEIHMADGPQGIRNDTKSTLYPCGVAAASTWDRKLIYKMGMGLGQDSRARGIHILLGPGANIYRSPLCGRNFEYFGEDPYLAGETAASYIEGVQSQGVMTCMKHYAANNQELDRNHFSSDIDERTLNEIYLPAFEKGVKQAHTGAIMNSYNLINSVHATENRYLNIDVLRNRWGFKGILMSDWEATYTTINAAYNGLDIEMPRGWLLDPAQMKQLIINGVLDERIIDQRVQHIIQTLLAFGFFDRPQKDEQINEKNPFSENISIEVERSGAVLLRNYNNLLPINKGKIVVCGPNSEIIVKGGGSGEAFPSTTCTTAQGLQQNLNYNRQLCFGYTPNLWKKDLNTFYADSSCTTRGAIVEYFNSTKLSGKPVHTAIVHEINYKTWDSLLPGVVNSDNFSDRYTFYFKPENDAILYFSVGGDDGYRLLINNKELIEQWSNHPFRSKEGYKSFKAGQVYKITYEHFDGGSEAEAMFRYADYLNDPKFIKAIRNADAVIVCVGYDWYLESESWDRPFTLPEGHLACLENILKYTNKVIVVINSGGGVEMSPWIDRVSGILMAWYQGQEGGKAIADIITGKTSPSGKLPFTIEKRLEDNPTYGNYYPNTNQVKPDNPYKRIEYNEGIFMGYRGYERSGIKPMFEFGFGLSYSQFEYNNIKAQPSEDGYIISFDVKNTGNYDAAEIAQIYVGDVNASAIRPVKELKGYEKVFLKKGETQHIEIFLGEEAFRFYDYMQHKFVVEPGEFNILIGSSSQDIRLTTRIDVKTNAKSTPFFFIQLSDPQFGFTDNNKSISAEINAMNKAITAINRLKPPFIVITGDFVNDPNSEKQISTYKHLIAQIDPSIKVYMIPGNHDIGDVSQTAIDTYIKNYGDTHFSFTFGDCAFIGIDSNIIKEEDKIRENIQFQWLKQELQKIQATKFKFIFTHCPIFLKHVDEPVNYSNFPTHMREKYIRLFQQYEVNAVFAGHLHNNSYGKAGSMEMITIGPVGKVLGTGYQGLNIIKVYPDRYVSEFIPLEKLPQKIIMHTLK